MADSAGWRPAFLLLSVVGLVYAPVLLIALRGLPANPASQHRSSTGAAYAFLGSATYRALAVAFFCFCGVLWMLYAWLPSFLYERFQLSMAESGLAATIYLQASSALGALFWGAASDRWAVARAGARVYVLAALILVAGPLAYLTIAAPSLALLKVFSAAFGFFAGGVVGNIFGAVFDIIPAANYGVGAGTMNMIGGVAGGLGVLFAGRWKESYGLDHVMLVSGVAAAAAGLAVLLVARARVLSDRQRFVR